MAAVAAPSSAAASASASLYTSSPLSSRPRSSRFSPKLLLGNSFKTPLSHPGFQRFSLQPIRATSSTEEVTTTTTASSVDSEDILADLKAKWDAIENKTNVFIYGGGALVALWLSSTLVGAVNSVPLLPKVLELVGLGYTGWFVYRYLLFKESRKELARDIEELKAKVTGAGDDN